MEIELSLLLKRRLTQVLDKMVFAYNLGDKHDVKRAEERIDLLTKDISEETGISLQEVHNFIIQSFKKRRHYNEKADERVPSHFATTFGNGYKGRIDRSIS